MVGHLSPEVAKFVAATDELSALLIAPFVEAASAEFGSLPQGAQEDITLFLTKASERWQEVRDHDESARIEAGLTVEEWAERRHDNIVLALANLGFGEEQK